jgi:hypothetical protein
MALVTVSTSIIGPAIPAASAAEVAGMKLAGDLAEP